MVSFLHIPSVIFHVLLTFVYLHTGSAIEALKSTLPSTAIFDSAGNVNVQTKSLGDDGQSELSRERTVSLALVVVRCDESLDWVKGLGAYVPPPFHLTRLHVVEKCPDMHAKGAALASLLGGIQIGAAPPVMTVSNLKNVGSQLYGYVTHILDYYEHLDDYTAFLSATPESTFDLCSLPEFLKLALKRGYVGLGFQYSQSSTNGFVLMDSCRGRGVPLHEAGATVGMLGSQFVASRSAIHFSHASVFNQYRKCFESLTEVQRPQGIKKAQWDQVAPGAAECVKWDQYGHMLFGMPRVLPDQEVLPCQDRPITTYPAIVMPILSIVPLWSPCRLMAISLALIAPTVTVLWLFNSNKVVVSKTLNSDQSYFGTGSSIPSIQLMSSVE